MSLQHRLRLDHVQEEKVQRPAKARSEVSAENGVVRIVIPMRRVHPVVLALMLVPIAVLAMFVGALLQFFRQTHTPEPVSWFFLGFLILIFGILPTSGALGAFMRSRFGRTTVTVSTTGIRIDERGVWRTKAIAKIDAADIIEVDYSATRSQAVNEPADRVVAFVNTLVNSGGISVKTRQGLTTFAEALTDDEIRYLHSVVRRSLAR